MSPFTIAISNIKPYLVDFLLGQYSNFVKDRMLIASLKIYPGQCIIELLSTPPPNPIINSDENSPSTLIISLPYYDQLNVRGRNYLSKNAQNIFKKRMQRHYYSILVNYIEKAKIGKIDFIDAVDRFMEIKKINPDNISRNSIIKQYYRFREKENGDNYLNFSKKKHYLECV